LMNIYQCQSCGAYIDNISKRLILGPSKQNHKCTQQHLGPWVQRSLPVPQNGINGYHQFAANGGYPPNGYAQQPAPHQTQHVAPQQPPVSLPQQAHAYAAAQPYSLHPQHQHQLAQHPLAHSPKHHQPHSHQHHVQKSSSFKPSTPSPRSPSPCETDRKSNELSMSDFVDCDLDAMDQSLVEAFKAELNEYNTEIELTFGSDINFTPKFAVYVSSIRQHKVRDIIALSVNKKQEVFLTETVDGKGQGQRVKNPNQAVDQRPTYVRYLLQLIYYAFLNTVYDDSRYERFYGTYYETEKQQSKHSEQGPQEAVSTKRKGGSQQDVDPFFQCFYECSTIFATFVITKDGLSIGAKDVRDYLELVAGNIVAVLKLMNRVLCWANDSKASSLRLVLPRLRIDVSLYELSQLLQCVQLETQHAVWQRIDKNSENQISDQQNLSLCIHILLCIAIKHKQSDAQYPNTQNPDKVYAEFLEKVVDCLCAQFLAADKEQGGIVMEFGDLVEKLPLWLLKCDKILQSQAQTASQK